MKNVRNWLYALLPLLNTLILGAATPPNVLFIFTDDHRPDGVATVGNPDVKTPHLDRLIERGTLFTQAYIQGSMTQATCLPSRSMLMSGKSLFRAPRQLDQGTILPEAFRQAGYRTFIAGKWHNGTESLLRSFDEAEAVFLGGSAGTHVNVPLNYREGDTLERYAVPGVFSSVLFADAAVQFLKRQKSSGSPFFCYIPFTAPHSPLTPPDEFATMYDPDSITLPVNHESRLAATSNQDNPTNQRRRRGGDPRQTYAAYYGMITHMDREIGRVLHTLESEGLKENTIVVFATDHGMSMGSHGQNGKANAYEHTSRSLLSFSGPGIPSGKRTPALTYLFDIYPTLCELTGTKQPGGLEGRSLAPVITGKTNQVRDYLFTAYLANDRAIRNKQFKLFTRLDSRQEMLFDLLADPHELNDLAAQPRYAPVLETLRNQLKQAQSQYDDTPERVAEFLQRRGRRGRGR